MRPTILLQAALAAAQLEDFSSFEPSSNRDQQLLRKAASDYLSNGTLSNGARPNVVFILTDDQDAHLESLRYMPFVKKHLIDKGTHFKKHYCTTAICCPSRVTIWTGQLAHNTNVTDVRAPYGGYPKFVSQGYNSAYLPVWLEYAGYNSYYTGKLFNAHSVTTYNDPYPAGFKHTVRAPGPLSVPTDTRLMLK
jgi:arylsulfatase A-like enzyme